MMINPWRSAKCPVRTIHSPVPATSVAPMNVSAPAIQITTRTSPWKNAPSTMRAIAHALGAA